MLAYLLQFAHQTQQKKKEGPAMGFSGKKNGPDMLLGRSLSWWVLIPMLGKWCVLLACLGAVAGCRFPQAEEKTTTKPLIATKLKVVVLEDSQLAETLRSYQGQWQAETGSQFEVEAISDSGALPANADVVVFRSSQLGRLAEGAQLLPLTDQVLAPYTPAWTDLVEMVRDQEGRWGTEVYGVTLGSPVLVCYCRQDLLDWLGVAPPRSWEEYLQVAQQLKDGRRLAEAGLLIAHPWAPALEPLAVGWAGWTLLARAASYAKHPDYYSTLFEMHSMEPQIAEPPFVRALEELVATAKLAQGDLLKEDPHRLRERFWRGECGLALTWPSRAGPDKAPPGIKCTIVPIPGASALWHPAEQKWIPAPKGQVFRTPLLGMAGRWAAVGAGSSQPDAALQLVFWLADKQGSEPRAAVCPATTVFRKRDLQDPHRLGVWVEAAMPPQTAQDYALALQETFSSPQGLVGLRIPGWQEYMAALDEAVHAAVEGKKTPAKALQEAAQKWRQITGRFGLQRQRRAYRHNLGLED